MFIPFVLVQPILAAITLVAYYTGIIPPITNIAPWTMPTGLGAFFNTNGSVALCWSHSLTSVSRRWCTCHLW